MKFNIPPLVHKTPEELSRERRERTVLKLEQARAERPGRHVFSAVSLAGWMEQVRAAGIPFVPAEIACTVPVDTILGCEDPLPEHAPHWQRLADACSLLGPTEMTRWDCCAGLDMKGMMQDGGQKTDDAYLLAPDDSNPALPRWRVVSRNIDPRVFDLVFDYPGDDIPVIKRPWVEARRDGTHPVEYRVYVANGKVLGVANYYMQRPMTISALVRSEIEIAVRRTRTLLQHMETTGAVPFNLYADPSRTGLDPDKASCTLDFLVDTDGQVRFLEAGPPFGLGAHPCSFIENTREVNGRKVISVDGVALAPGVAPLPLEEFNG